MIKVRIDVDYPYPSRVQSFFYTALGIRLSKDYLLNSKIVARMINDTKKPVKAYWFFTTKTIPDPALLRLLNNDRHEICLHVVNDPYGELDVLQRVTGRSIRYFTIHGTARFLGRLMWRRKGREALIPKGFPLQDYTKVPITSFSLDRLVYYTLVNKVVDDVLKQEASGCDYLLYFHPIWLLQRGRLNHRGPFYEALRRILEIEDLHSYVVERRAFFHVARDAREYERTVVPSEDLLNRLMERKIDVLSFLERGWCCPLRGKFSWAKSEDNVALLHVESYENWLRSIGKKTRNMIRKAERSGITTAPVQPANGFAESVWKIYNETPIRQGRSFTHFGESLEIVKKNLALASNCLYIEANLDKNIVGFVQLLPGDNILIISQILSLQAYWDNAVNNALVAKAVDIAAANGMKWIMYGRIGNHPSLDIFKRNNGFVKYKLNRYYIALTWKGKLAVTLGLQKSLKDAMPQSMKNTLIPFYNWVSRTKMKMRF